MRPAPLVPIPDRPALEFTDAVLKGGPTIVLADLHLGLGSSEVPTSVPAAALARTMAWDLVGLGRERHARGFLIVGDVKHPIVGTPIALRPVVFDFFSTLLRAGFDAEVVLGNHDVGLARWLPREVRVHPARGIVRAGVGFFHGHRWPSNTVLRAARLVVGHLHPGFRFAPTAEAPAMKQRCWVRVALPPPPEPSRRRPAHGPIRARELVVLPAFNPIAGTESLNRERPKRGRSFLVHRFLSRGPARAYLLDGTDVGEVLTPSRIGQSSGREERGPRDR
jgi:metallophosphoesterase superfamily enzyme